MGKMHLGIPDTINEIQVILATTLPLSNLQTDGYSSSTKVADGAEAHNPFYSSPLISSLS